MARRKKTPPTPIEATIHALSHDGRGIASVEGKTTFVIGALPGEKVSITLLKSHSKYNEGVAHQIHTVSADRVSPGCAHFTRCGGCRIQHMPPSLQVKTKLDAFKEIMTHHGEAEPKEWAPPLEGVQWGYRRKARLSVRFIPKKEKVLVGFRELNGYYVADNHQCPILISPVDNLLQKLSELIFSLSAKEHIPQIELSAGDHVTALMFRHLEPLIDSDIQALKNFGKAYDLHIYLQPHGYDSLALIEPAGENARLNYELDGMTFEFKPEQFVQINGDMNAKMLTQALDWLDLKSDDRVLDLFCGIGNFSLPIAKRISHLTGVEGDETAVTQAYSNAEKNSIQNVNFSVCNLFELPKNAPWINRTFNKLLLDPPRAGAEEIVTKIKLFHPEIIVYVSCHPATLARDTKTLIAAGYTLEKAGIMDMFPQTQHVEAMALFRRH
jgi:23S rRNA (uracil1939-C5)-methyltransferase